MPLDVYCFGYLLINGKQFILNFITFNKFTSFNYLKSPFISVPVKKREEFIASKQETVVKNYLSASKQSNNNSLGGNAIRKLIDGNFIFKFFIQF